VSDRVDRFLASRCSKEFLADYIKEHPEVLDRASKPGLYLSSVAAVDLAVSLHESGLLPEGYRLTFVETVVDYAMEGEDLYAIENDRIQSVFTPGELNHRARFSCTKKRLDFEVAEAKMGIPFAEPGADTAPRRNCHGEYCSANPVDRQAEDEAAFSEVS